MEINDFPVGTIIASTDLTIVEINNVFLSLLGYCEKEIKKTPVDKICFKENDIKTLRACFASVKDTTKLNITLKDKSGAAVSGELSIKKVDYKGGNYLLTFHHAGYYETIKNQWKTPDGSFLISCQDYPDPVVITTVPEGKFIEVNNSFEKISEYTRDEIIGKTITRFGLYQDLKEREILFKELGKTGSLSNYEIRYVTKSGKILDTQFSAELIKVQGEDCLISVVRDITEQKKAQNMLKASEEQIKDLFNHAPNGICLCNPDGVLIMGNYAFEKLTGIRNKDLIGKTFDDLKLFPPGQVPAFNKLLRKCISEKQEKPEQFMIVRSDKKEVLTEIIAHPLKIKGERNIMFILRDITGKELTERKLQESEKMLRSFIKAAPIGIGIVVNRAFTYVNHYLLMMLGYTEDELIGKKSQMLYPDENEYKRVSTEKYNINKPNADASIETKFKTKNGKVLDILLQTTPLDINDLAKGTVFTATDITKQKRNTFLNKIIYNISNAAATATSMPDYIKTIRDELGKEINTSNFFVALYDKETDSISSPYMVDEKDSFTSWPAKKTLTGYVIKRQKPLFITKSEIMELVNARHIDIVGTVSEVWIGVPMIIGEEAIGAIVVQDYDNPNAYSNDDFEILKLISHQISISVKRKKAEEKLNELQEYLQLQIDSMPIGLIVWDEYLQVKSWNPSAEKIFGYTEEEAIGKHAFELIIPEELQPRVEKIWNTLLKGNDTGSITNENLTKTGEIIICQWSNMSLKNEKGKVLGVMSMVQDITEKYKAEQALKDSEEKYRNLINQSPDGIFAIDRNGNFISVNKIICRFFGKDENDILSSNAWEFFPEEQKKQALSQIAKLKNGESRITPLEYKIKGKDGKERSIEIVSSPYYENGIITGIQGIARDVTFRKETEKKLKQYQENLEELVKERTARLETQTVKLQESHKALSFLLDDVNQSRKELEESNSKILKLSQAVEQSPVTVIITDTNGNIEYVNQNFCKVTGYSVDEVAGKNPSILNSGKHPKNFFKNMWSAIKLGQAWHGEICNRKKSGELYWENSSISPLRNQKNVITHFIAVKEDITERKNTENKLKEYTQELELFNKLMVDRELKIIEVKEEVNHLCKELGREIKYPPVWKESEN